MSDKYVRVPVEPPKMNTDVDWLMSVRDQFNGTVCDWATIDEIYRAAIAAAPQANHPEQPQRQDYETRHAIMEAERNAACDEYFKARPQIDFIGNRRIFEAGFQRGFEVKPSALSAPAQAQDERERFLKWREENDDRLDTYNDPDGCMLMAWQARATAQPAQKPITVEAASFDVLTEVSERLHNAGVPFVDEVGTLISIPDRVDLLAAQKPEDKAEQQAEPIGEMRDSGVVWFNQNPHAYPVGTKFYTASTHSADMSKTGGEIDRLSAERVKAARYDWLIQQLHGSIADLLHCSVSDIGLEIDDAIERALLAKVESK